MGSAFERGKFVEADLEVAFIELFQTMGYKYVSGDCIHRTLDEVLIEEDLIKFIQNKYHDKDLIDIEIKRIINHIKLIPATPLYIGNREAYRLISEGVDLKREDTSNI